MTDGAAETIGEFLESYRSKIKQINESSLQVIIYAFRSFSLRWQTELKIQHDIKKEMGINL